jgi:hypothetical protein
MKLIYRTRRQRLPNQNVRSTHWTDVVSMIFSIFSFIGVGALIWQIDQVERAIKGETYSKIYDQEFQLFQNLLNDTTYYDYFYEGKITVPGTVQHKKVTVLIAMFADYIEQICLQKENLDSDVQVAWEEWIYGMYESTPMLRQHYDDFLSIYSRQCQKLISEFKVRYNKTNDKKQN